MMLDLWPDAARTALEGVIRAAAHIDQPFVVLDADNTLWEHDLEEALLTCLEHQGRVSIDSLDPAIRPIPTLPGESLFGYYMRLCDFDDNVSYLWILQVFSGFSLGELYQEIIGLIDHGEPLEAMVMRDGALRPHAVPIPKPHPAQAQLISTLERAGVRVWVVSAALEELVRMVASDPHFGLKVAPQRVVGANLLLRAPDGSVTFGAADRRRGNPTLDWYHSAERMALRYTHHPVAPMPWYSGKLAAIKTSIHPSRRPLLVGGDAPSDLIMQFYADVDAGGARLRIHAHPSRMQELEAARAARRTHPGADPDPDAGWIIVEPIDLRG